MPTATDTTAADATPPDATAAETASAEAPEHADGDCPDRAGDGTAPADSVGGSLHDAVLGHIVDVLGRLAPNRVRAPSPAGTHDRPAWPPLLPRRAAPGVSRGGAR